MPNKHRAEVDASVFGKGSILRLNTPEAADLEALFGDDWISVVLFGLDRNSPRVIKAVVELGLFNNKGTKVPAAQIEWPDVPLKDLSPICSDAVLLSLYGKTAAELHEEAKAKAAAGEAKADADPQTASAEA